MTMFKKKKEKGFISGVYTHQNGNVPGLKLIVINAVCVSEDEEVVLFVAFAGFVFHVPVVLSCYLIVVPSDRQTETERNSSRR